MATDAEEKTYTLNKKEFIFIPTWKVMLTSKIESDDQS